jgi:hypothetical protein
MIDKPFSVKTQIVEKGMDARLGNKLGSELAYERYVGGRIAGDRL